ncbi:MAG: macro domain-containing protein, partial [Candidatus Zixiibacteriota bacterium]
ITGAYHLPARFVIHTVGPIYGSCAGREAKLLADCYRNSLSLAGARGLGSIAFPAISTGVYGYPIQEAGRIAVGAVLESMSRESSIKEVRFVLFTRELHSIYEELLGKLERQEEH